MESQTTMQRRHLLDNPYDHPGMPLPAHKHSLIAALLQKHSCELNRLVDGLGSPLHFLLPQIFEENVSQLRREFSELGLNGTILFAKKANKADCFTKACARLGIGLDVASAQELAKALAAGVVGERIGVSGPEKDDQLIALCLRHRCLIAIDSVNELQRVIGIAKDIRCRANLLLRCLVDSQRNSRFGLTLQEREIALRLCLSHRNAISLQGFSFHLSGYSSLERAKAANEMIDLCVGTRALGFPMCNRVNMGGGLAVQYVDPKSWSRFLEQSVPEHFHAKKTFGAFYPYGAERNSAESLLDILKSEVESGVTLADKAKANRIEFTIEPGRALLDQAGFTVFSVQGVKDRHATDGYAIVTVHGSSLSLSEQWFNSEFLPDPILIPAEKSDNRVFFACIGASTCLESDMLTWRKVGFPRPIEVGDRLLYLNTAGYQMDSNESPFHDVDLPRKVVLEFRSQKDGLRWQLDGM